MSEPIPLVDVALQHRRIADDLLPTLHALMERGAFIGGEAVEAFEQAYADASRRRHCVGVASGTDALELMLRAHDIGAGDDVLVPANSFIATAAAVVRAGATPRFVDCDPIHLLVDPAAAADRSRTARAVIAVHLYGQLAPVDELAVALDGSECLVLEDAAQAHGATRHGQTPASWGGAAATSFYPGKNLGAYGDGGAVLTDSDEVARRLALLSDHGSAEKYVHECVGWNSRLDALQAAVLSVKLRALPEWNEERRTIARGYDALLGDDDRITLPRVLPGNDPVWHLYVVRVPDRDGVRARLEQAGIGVGVHYPVPIHLQPAFRSADTGTLPNAERAAREILSLPIYPGMTESQVSRVADELRAALP